MARYRVVRGISYGTPEKYAGPGAIVADLSPKMVEWMVADGEVEKVAEKPQQRKVN